MNCVSIFSKSWTDLAFEGRNQSYGAYCLRREHPKTLLLAFFYGILIVISVVGIISLYSLITKEESVVLHPDVPIRATHVTFDPFTPTPPERPQGPSKQSVAIPTPIASSNPDPEPERASDTETAASGTSMGDPGGTNVGSTGTGTIPEPESTVPELATTVMLDRQPAFPGGMDKFYSYVGKNFRSLESDYTTTVKVYVSFVIELDGAISNIKVLRDPGLGAGEEAVRVLKSLKTKWEPGMIKGQAVRTTFTLPITVELK